VVEAIGGKVGDAAAEVERSGRSTAGAARGASKDLEATVKDAAARVKDGAPLDDVVRRLERRWPGTDEERYDRAFQRGYARGRSGRLAVGLAIGATAAAAGTWLLDPDRGAGRRARLAAQGRQLVERGRRELEARGITAPGGSSTPAEPKLLPATASPGAIGEIPSQREQPGMTGDPLTPVAAGTVAAEGHDAATTGSGS
jgi:hypothetical protein